VIKRTANITENLLTLGGESIEKKMPPSKKKKPAPAAPKREVTPDEEARLNAGVSAIKDWQKRSKDAKGVPPRKTKLPKPDDARHGWDEEMSGHVPVGEVRHEPSHKSYIDPKTGERVTPKSKVYSVRGIGEEGHKGEEETKEETRKRRVGERVSRSIRSTGKNKASTKSHERTLMEQAEFEAHSDHYAYRQQGKPYPIKHLPPGTQKVYHALYPRDQHHLSKAFSYRLNHQPDGKEPFVKDKKNIYKVHERSMRENPATGKKTIEVYHPSRTNEAPTWKPTLQDLHNEVNSHHAFRPPTGTAKPVTEKGKTRLVKGIDSRPLSDKGWRPEGLADEKGKRGPDRSASNRQKANEHYKKVSAELQSGERPMPGRNKKVRAAGVFHAARSAPQEETKTLRVHADINKYKEALASGSGAKQNAFEQKYHRSRFKHYFHPHQYDVPSLKHGYHSKKQADIKSDIDLKRRMTKEKAPPNKPPREDELRKNVQDTKTELDRRTTRHAAFVAGHKSKPTKDEIKTSRITPPESFNPANVTYTLRRQKKGGYKRGQNHEDFMHMVAGNKRYEVEHEGEKVTVGDKTTIHKKGDIVFHGGRIGEKKDSTFHEPVRPDVVRDLSRGYAQVKTAADVHHSATNELAQHLRDHEAAKKQYKKDKSRAATLNLTTLKKQYEHHTAQLAKITPALREGWKKKMDEHQANLLKNPRTKRVVERAQESGKKQEAKYRRRK
jgi:hypothetical protein